MSSHIRATAPADRAAPRIETDPSVLSTVMTDAAHVPGGHAAGLVTPRDVAEISAAVLAATRVLPIGAQSSLTGGATPRGDMVLGTRALTSIERLDRWHVRVGAGVPLTVLQQRLAAEGLYYPPVPTYEGAFVGGTVATNAAGAATFKYGATRAWVDGLTVVLADGGVLEFRRGEVQADGGLFRVRTANAERMVPVPTYRMPDVAKLSAGYFARPNMDLVDLFVGSEGTLGVIAGATLRVVSRPERGVALIECAGDEQAVLVTSRLREAAQAAWTGNDPLDIAAVEYMDHRSLTFVPDAAFADIGRARPPNGYALLLVQIEVTGDESPALVRLQEILDTCGVAADPVVAMPHDERASQRLFQLREAVPAGVNAAVGRAKQADTGIEKTAGDMIVPFAHLTRSIEIYRRAFETRDLAYAIWGHASDGNLHPNVIPRSRRDVEAGREALLEIAHTVMSLGGSPLAEHGVGRSALKQRLLRELYGDEGIDEMRRVKRALDPEGKLSAGVLFPPDDDQPIRDS